MKYSRSFGLFWWNFVVCDDWRVAAGLAVALFLTWLLEHNDVSAESVRRETRRSSS
jgi:hypothetical protein